MSYLPVISCTRTPLYVIAGQSNAVGYASNIADTNLCQSYGIRYWENTDYRTPFKIETVSARPDGGFGLEMSLAEELGQSCNNGGVIVKVARNGSHNPAGTGSLADDVNVIGLSWHPAREELFSLLLEELRKVQIKTTRSFIKAFIWFQGETDMAPGLPWAAEYVNNLNVFLAVLRERYPTLEKFYIVRVKLNAEHPNYNSPEMNHVRDGIETVAAAHDDVTMIDIDDYYGDVAGPHLRPSEYESLGRRIFHSIHG